MWNGYIFTEAAQTGNSRNAKGLGHIPIAHSCHGMMSQQNRDFLSGMPRSTPIEYPRANKGTRRMSTSFGSYNYKVRHGVFVFSTCIFGYFLSSDFHLPPSPALKSWGEPRLLVCWEEARSPIRVQRWSMAPSENTPARPFPDFRPGSSKERRTSLIKLRQVLRLMH